MSMLDPNVAFGEDQDPELQRMAIEQLAHRINALRTNTPQTLGPTSENMVSGRYVIPFADIARQFMNPIMAGMEERRLTKKMQDYHKSRLAANQQVLESMPHDKDGNIDTSNKGKMLKWVIEAAEKDAPLSAHILPQVIKGIFPSDATLLANGGMGKLIPLGDGTLFQPGSGKVLDPDPQGRTARAQEDSNIAADRQVDVWKRTQNPKEDQIKDVQLKEAQAKLDQTLAGKPLLANDRQRFLELAESAANGLGLHNTFKDEYAGGVTTTARNILGKTLGATSKYLDPKAQEVAKWWSNYDYLQNIQERFEKFGASLTANEKKAWDEATVNPNMDPKIVRDKLAARLELIKKHAESFRGSLKAGGYNTDEANKIFSIYGLTPKGRKLEQGVEYPQESLKPGDELGGNIWDGKSWVAPKDYEPAISLPLAKPGIKIIGAR